MRWLDGITDSMDMSLSDWTELTGTQDPYIELHSSGGMGWWGLHGWKEVGEAGRWISGGSTLCTPMVYSVNVLQKHHTKWKKPDMKEYMVYACSSIKLKLIYLMSVVAQGQGAGGVDRSFFEWWICFISWFCNGSYTACIYFLKLKELSLRMVHSIVCYWFLNEVAFKN